MRNFLFFPLFLCAMLFSCNSENEVNPSIDPPQEEMGLESIQLENDFQITPTGGAASEAQGGQGIELSFDGNTHPETHYHSRWGNGTVLPVTLEYFFEGNKEAMDYIIYHTRNGNGNFGEFDLYIATENTPDYKLYDSYDFNMQNAPSRIELKDSPKGITKVKFVVKTGLGGFVSCSEMQFFRKNTEKQLDRQLLAVFSDLTCSTLKPNVSEEAINDLPEYFKQLATLIQKDSYSPYEKEFRIQTYHPYSHPEEWAEKLMTKKYSHLNNPTGISVKKGDEILLLVGDTHGHTLCVQNVGEETVQDSNGSYVQTAASGDSYFLQEGVNKIAVNQTGMLFIF